MSFRKVLSNAPCRKMLLIGKNLMLVNSYEDLKNYIKARFSNDLNSGSYTGVFSNITSNGLHFEDSDTNYIYNQCFSGLEPNTQYTISGQVKTNDNLYIYLFLNTRVNPPNTEYQKKTHTFTTDNLGNYDSNIRFLASSNNVSITLDIKELQLEKGAIATDYEAPKMAIQMSINSPLRQL